MDIKRMTATIGVTALAAAPLIAAGPATAAEREFRYGGARIEYDVEKDDGRFEVDVDIDGARPGSRWRVTLWHDGVRYHSRVHTADREGDVDIDKSRRNTKGADVFKLRVKKIGGAPAVTRTIRLR